jgi:hypothetical protein
MAAEFPLSLEFGGQPDRFADKRVFEIQIVGSERGIIMSKKRTDATSPHLQNRLNSPNAVSPIDMPAKHEENLPDASHGRTK